MKFKQSHTVKEIAELLGCSFVGSPHHIVSGINEIHKVENGDLVFVDHSKYYGKALKSAATTVLIDQEVECPEGKALIISKSPFDDYNKLARHFSPFIPQKEAVSKEAVIHESAIIYPNVFIGKNVEIGPDVVIYAGASIGDNTKIDEGAVVGPNSVVGHAAFYYKKKPTGYDRMHTCGGVHLQKNVELGGLCTVDAGVSALTVIGEGTKLDNHVHVGHDTVIGKNCLMAAGVGLAGCVVVEDNVTLWGQVGCASDIVIGEGAVVLAQSGIAKSLAGGKTYFGSPCAEAKSKLREMAALRKLPEILESL
ncbi:MAG: UDP-3-O-(3-hydroxymyristoyl)glucosamine N-acyltransferase [Crocinitomicaceae bacterium]|nr:UDP-3-O-(3-hydroxymyristoyl)glucosamine N-acyltransferase [Crocinitomicaceae bacterium]